MDFASLAPELEAIQREVCERLCPRPYPLVLRSSRTRVLQVDAFVSRELTRVSSAQAEHDALIQTAQGEYSLLCV